MLASTSCSLLNRKVLLNCCGSGEGSLGRAVECGVCGRLDLGGSNGSKMWMGLAGRGSLEAGRGVRLGGRLGLALVLRGTCGWFGLSGGVCGVLRLSWEVEGEVRGELGTTPRLYMLRPSLTKAWCRAGSNGGS
jgi:hypothetical protein